VERTTTWNDGTICARLENGNEKIVKEGAGEKTENLSCNYEKKKKKESRDKFWGHKEKFHTKRSDRR